MLPDERIRELLRDVDEHAHVDAGALASIFSNVDAERRQRLSRPRWYGALVRAAPALAGAAAALVIIVGLVALQPDKEPAATPGSSPTEPLGTATAPAP